MEECSGNSSELFLVFNDGCYSQKQTNTNRNTKTHIQKHIRKNSTFDRTHLSQSPSQGQGYMISRSKPKNIKKSQKNTQHDSNVCKYCRKQFKCLSKHEWRCKEMPTNFKQAQHTVWTYEENKKLMQLYYQSEPCRRGYRQRLYRLWKECGIQKTINEQNLSGKVRYILKSDYFTNTELCALKHVRIDDEEELLDHEDIISLEYDAISDINTNVSMNCDNSSLSYPMPANQTLNNILQTTEVMNDEENFPNLKQHSKNPYLYALLSELNNSLVDIKTNDITILRKIYQACAQYICKKLNVNKIGSLPNQKENKWKNRLEITLNNTRKEIGRLLMFLKGRLKNTTLCTKIKNKFISNSDIEKEVENLKQKAKVIAFRIKTYTFNEEYKYNNLLFESNPSQYFKTICEKRVQTVDVKDFNKTESLKFWEDLWGEKKNFNKNAVWLPDVYNTCLLYTSPSPRD